MKTCLSAFDLWEVVKNEKEPPQLPANPTVTQMKNYSEEKAKRYKAKSCIESSVSDDIFIRIMTCETAKQAWDVLKEEFQGSDKTKQMQMLNLRREFEVLKMKEFKNLKKYNDRLMKIVNKIRLLGEELSDKRIVEKVLVSLPERFESKISSLEDSKDLTKITPVELFNILQAQKQRRAIRQEDSTESAFTAKEKGKMQTESKGRKQGDRRNKGTVSSLVTWRRTSSSAWLIDSGCTHHMASDINMFKELDKTCTSKVRIGIEHQLTATYTPQQNGVNERKNRTIMEMARCMLFEKNLSKKFWAEAVNTSVYLLNRLPTKALKGNTPFEAWYGSKPSVHHLRVFGSICYVFVPDIKRDKLDQKAEICIFLGYSNITKGYRTYNPLTGKMIVSKNVRFNEQAAWNWEKLKRESVKQTAADMISFQDQEDYIFENEIIDHEPVRGIRPLIDIYQRSNVVILEPASFEEAVKISERKNAMKEEIQMIEKN
ncbi:uncharacterized protein LOC111309412 [Durio zibethinus]|uniref:Uncharacterized protein LOC111309412 n=1 Tax=Durio zibethinus TaxID=66656 RepID=A0A6P6AH64_DURZI|nr:uncharacterized protein LOC111309412 [Durio zibethinus]